VRAAAAVLVATGVLLAACGGTDPPASSTGTTLNPAVHLSPATPTTSTTTTTPVGPVTWSPCGALQCGSVTVPLDYGHPDGPTIQIAVARHPAEVPSERIGSLVINPGGPGASGIDDLPNELSALAPEVLDRFDLVSFDPRGVDRSSPVRCSGGSDSGSSSGTTQPAVDPVPTTPAARQALLSNDQAFAAQCQHYSGTILPYMGTVDTARDLDRLRAALGDATLTYIGHSYGTLLGATYADLFPTRVRAMVLDGAIDPASTTTAYATEQAMSLESALGSFFAWCAADAGCSWRPTGDPTTALLGLIQDSRNRPLTAGGGTAGPAELYDALLAGLESQSSWPTLAVALEAAGAGNGAPAVVMSDRYETGGSPNAAEAEQAIDCLDHPVDRSPSSYVTLADDIGQSAPVFGPLLAWGLLGCATWPALPTRSPAPASDPGAPPILVVGTTGDPVTPYAWAVALAGELTGGLLLTWRGASHVASFYSPCVRAASAAYLVSGTLPASGATCTD
jgi:pimeloyl-ACP methyl ester carboxylesterase